MAIEFRAALRRFAQAAAGTLALAAFGAPAQAQTEAPVTVHIAAIPVNVTGNLYYAQDLGLFKKAGVDVQIVTLASTAITAESVASGAVDMGTTNLVTIANAHLNGFPLLVVAPAGANSTASPIEGIIVAKDSPIKTAKDLEGKTVGTSVLKNNLVIETSAWMEKHGADPSTVKWVQVPNPATEAFVATQKVDASTLAEAFISSALAAGDVRLLTYLGADVAPVVIEGGYITNQAFYAAHPDAVRKVRDALLAAGKWANSHHAEAAAIMLKYNQQTPSPIAHYTVFPETFKASDLQPIIDAAARYGVLKSTFPAGDMVIPDH